MPQIGEWTLVIAIQAVAAEIREWREAVKSADAIPAEHQHLEDLIEAAEDLERAYDVAAQTMLNLPAYHELVRD